MATLSIWACNESTQTTTTSKGYKYDVIESVNGKAINPGDIVKLELKAVSNTGDVIQEAMKGDNAAILQIPSKSSPSYYDTPIPEVIDTCSVGDSVLIFLPIDSIPRVPPHMQDYEYVQYEVRILGAQSQEEFAQENDDKKIAAKTLVDETIEKYKSGQLDLKTTETGLKYVIHEKGSGNKVNNGDLTAVNYYGALLDGSSFDNSFQRGQAFTFPVGQGRVIKGWDEGVQLLNVGDKVTFFIPSELGYGKAGAGADIPGDSELVFYVEVLDANPSKQ